MYKNPTSFQIRSHESGTTAGPDICVCLFK